MMCMSVTKVMSDPQACQLLGRAGSSECSKTIGLEVVGPRVALMLLSVVEDRAYG